MNLYQESLNGCNRGLLSKGLSLIPVNTLSWDKCFYCKMQVHAAVFDAVVFLYVEWWNWLCCLSVYLPHFSVCLCVCKVSLSWHQEYVTVHIVWILMWQFTTYQSPGFPTKEESLKDVNVNLSELDFNIFRLSCSETTHYSWIFCICLFSLMVCETL